VTSPSQFVGSSSRRESASRLFASSSQRKRTPGSYNSEGVHGLSAIQSAASTQLSKINEEKGETGNHHLHLLLRRIDRDLYQLSNKVSGQFIKYFLISLIY
jgi:phage protein U